MFPIVNCRPLQDSTEVQNVDAVIYCTGYQYAYPFLEGTGLITCHDMRVDPLWQHIFPPSVAPTLAFVGLAWKSIRNQQFELQVCCTCHACVHSSCTQHCAMQHGMARRSMHSTAQRRSAQSSISSWLLLLLPHPRPFVLVSSFVYL